MNIYSCDLGGQIPYPLFGGIHRLLCFDAVLLQLWRQCDDLHVPCRALPDSLPGIRSRNFGGIWQSRSHPRQPCFQCVEQEDWNTRSVVE